MAWPLASHFSTMLQTPNVAFRDPELKKATILRNEQGQPKPWSGAFAVVYKATLPSGDSKAIRVFSTESPDRHERYEQISTYINERKLNSLVYFEYQDSALRSTDGKWYPMIVMDWVDGLTLFQWCEKMSKARNTAALRAAADVWLLVVREVEEAGIAHGDYQQANIMVTPEGQMKLVDYDCMCVPALVGKRNLEIGVEPYQHPARNGATVLSPDLDHFSALMIYVALRALASDPTLWDKYVEQPGYDKLLFKKEDIQTPNKSALITELTASRDPEVAEFTGLLLRCAAGPMADVPQLWVATSPSRLVEPLLRAGQWKEALAQLQGFRTKDIPPHLRPLVDRAYEEVWKEKAWNEYQTLTWEVSEKSDRTVTRVCNDAFLQQFPVPPEVRERVLAARNRVILLDRLAQMAQLSKDKQILSGERSIAAIGNQFGDDYVYVLRPRVEKARKVVEMVESLLKLLSVPEPNEIRIAEAWAMVRKHKLQALVTSVQAERAELAVRRAPRLKILEGIKKGMPLDRQDKQVLSAWDESLLGECPQAKRYRKYYDTALRRRVKLDMLKEAMQYEDQRQIAELIADPLLKNYPFSGPLGTVLKTRADQWNHGQGMLDAMVNNDPEAFRKQFDVQSFTDDMSMFADYQNLLRDWIYQYVVPRKCNGLKPAMGRASLLPNADGTVAVRWTWPHPRFGSVCYLGVSPTKPLDTDRPEDISLAFGQQLTRAEWEQSGSVFTLTPDPQWNGLNVIVWGLVNVGPQYYPTEPLVLGVLEVKKKSSWFPWR
ncbi:MAG: hypothetical protein Q4D98_06630 [Planctomycetia bacterium]|nr:hypothetical protein [Planctomycetia bacterium]